MESNAIVTVISPELTPAIEDLVREKRIDWLNRTYHKGDLEGAWLVIASTDDEEANRQVFAEAQENRIFCNVVDVPPLCSFQVPSIVRRGALQIATSTGGASPALAKKIRKQLQEIFGEYYAQYLEALNELRDHIKLKYPQDQKQRAAILENFVNSDAEQLLRNGKLEEFRQQVEACKSK